MFNNRMMAMFVFLQKINSLSRNSNSHIVPSGPKLDQSHYADIEIKPKEERPRPPVSGGSTVYATFSKKVITIKCTQTLLFIIINK